MNRWSSWMSDVVSNVQVVAGRTCAYVHTQEVKHPAGIECPWQITTCSCQSHRDTKDLRIRKLQIQQVDVILTYTWYIVYMSFMKLEYPHHEQISKKIIMVERTSYQHRTILEEDAVFTPEYVLTAAERGVGWADNIIFICSINTNNILRSVFQIMCSAYTYHTTIHKYIKCIPVLNWVIP